MFDEMFDELLEELKDVKIIPQPQPLRFDKSKLAEFIQFLDKNKETFNGVVYIPVDIFRQFASPSPGAIDVRKVKRAIMEVIPPKRSIHVRALNWGWKCKNREGRGVIVISFD